MDIVILGSGNVATHLGKALVHAGNNILQVWSRQGVNAEELAHRLNARSTDRLDQVDLNADVYIIAVVDDAISDLITQLKHIKGNLNGMLVHTSGSTSMDVFGGRFDKVGVFYPLQTFSKSKEVDFQAIPILLEVSNSSQLDLLKNLASSISNRVEVVTSAQRKSLHIAAVFACNYTNFLYAIAQQLLEEHDLDFGLIRPLVKETADKAQLHAPKDVQTGPAIRKDMSIVRDHIKFLEYKKDWQEIYKLLSEELIKISTQK